MFYFITLKIINYIILYYIIFDYVKFYYIICFYDIIPHIYIYVCVSLILHIHPNGIRMHAWMHVCSPPSTMAGAKDGSVATTGDRMPSLQQLEARNQQSILLVVGVNILIKLRIWWQTRKSLTIAITLRISFCCQSCGIFGLCTSSTRVVWFLCLQVTDDMISFCRDVAHWPTFMCAGVRAYGKYHSHSNDMIFAIQSHPLWSIVTT